MDYNSGSNQASDLKLRARLSLNCATLPINYQLIVSVKKKRKNSTVEKDYQNLWKTNLNNSY